MARQKAPFQAPNGHNASHDTSAGTQLSAREYYNERYEKVDKKHRSICLYDVTNLRIDYIEGLWRESIISSVFRVIILLTLSVL